MAGMSGTALVRVAPPLGLLGVLAVAMALTLSLLHAPEAVRTQARELAPTRHAASAPRVEVGVPPDALEAARAFVSTAVVRRDLGRAWKLAAPSLRAGLSRKQWLTGAIPVVPYPADLSATLYKVLDVHGRHVLLGVVMQPAGHPELAPVVFALGLERYLAGDWRADYWAPYAAGAGFTPKD